MEYEIPNIIENFEFGETKSFKNLSVTPIFSKKRPKIEYVSLDEALEKQYLEIKEKTESGSVPELLAINESDFRVLALDGEELVGAKQNRVLNATILIDKKTKMIIPVSCVERDRWERRSEKFSRSETMMPAFSRREKMRSVSDSLKSGALGHRSDQGRVWEEMDERILRFNAPTETSAMHDVFDTVKDSLDDYVEKFSSE